jgi:hypothetical protein
MKNIFFFIFILLVGCSSINKVYMCGDRPCIDKKEFKKYSVETLTIEIQPINDKKNNTMDLAKLNIENNAQLNDNNRKNVKAKIKAEKMRLKNEKIRIKNEKTELKKVRKFRENEEKKLSKLTKKTDEKKLSKLTNKDAHMNKENQKKQIVNSNKDETIIKDASDNNKNDIQSICKIISDCNIDEIAEILTQKGRKKNFPDITAN